MFTVTRLNHAKGNDINGNPRRLYLIQYIENGTAIRVKVIKEAHRGTGAYIETYPDAVWMGEWELSPSQYNVFNKMAE